MNKEVEENFSIELQPFVTVIYFNQWADYSFGDCLTVYFDENDFTYYVNEGDEWNPRAVSSAEEVLKMMVEFQETVNAD